MNQDTPTSKGDSPENELDNPVYFMRKYKARIAALEAALRDVIDATPDTMSERLERAITKAEEVLRG